jgi:hypothetical protein
MENTMLDVKSLADREYRETWYHGSPSSFAILQRGSTVTLDRKLAETFSHKPALVSISSDGVIKHSGTAPGYLYRIAEEIEAGDVTPHPNSSMGEGNEWLTNRDLHVSLIGPVAVLADELLTAEEIQRLEMIAAE